MRWDMSSSGTSKMKVMLAKIWQEHINCSGCGSYLKIDQDDLRMTTEETVHVVCEVCDDPCDRSLLTANIPLIR